MKNLTRVLALVLALSLVLGTVAFASFTDVKTGDDYAEAIETLAALGIIKGYEDGSFGAEKAITRAEAVAIVNRIQGLEKAAAGAASASLYTDVAADHWAAGDINLATQMGIISGDGNGKFRPEDQVSYQEMVKMLTCAVNYQPAVEDLGGWPTGYLVAAQTYGILEDTTNLGAAAANRGVVAQLTFNTLTAPLMVQEGFGTNKTYKVKDGSEGDAQTLLDKKLKIYKVFATVDATEKTGEDVGTAKIDITENICDVKLANDLELDETKVLVGPAANIADKVGFSVVAYLKKNVEEDEWEVLYNAFEEGTNVEVVIASADIETVKSATADKKGYIEVVEDGKEVKYYIDAETIAYVNGTKTDVGVAIDDDTFNYASGDRRDGEVTLFYSKKNDDCAASIRIQEWTTDVVEEVSANGLKIFLRYGTMIDLDVEDTDREDKLAYTITLDGKEIAPSELKEDDVISYIAKTVSGISKPVSYTILVSRATVEGKSELYDDAEGIFTIAGTDYEVSASAVAAAGGDATTIGVTDAVKTGKVGGVFFLDAFGKVAGFDKVAGTAGEPINYGYFVSAMKDNFDEDAYFFEASIKMLTKDGTAIYNFVDEPVIETITKNGAELESSDVKYKIAEEENATARADFKAAMADIVAADALIAYKLDGDKIKTVYAFEGAAAAIGNSDYIAWNGDIEKANSAYSERNSRIGGYTVDANTIVFLVGAADVEDYAVTDAASYFVDDDETLYADTDKAIKVYGVNEDKVAGAMLVKVDLTSDIEKGNLAMFVKYAITTNEDDEQITRITYYQNGEEKTVDSEDKLTTDEMNKVKALVAGDIITFEANSKGYIAKAPVKVGPAINDSDLDAWNIEAPDAALKTPAYVNGMVIAKSGKTVRLGSDKETWENHVIPEDLKVYFVEKKNTKNVITVGTVNDIAKNMFYTEKGVNEDNDGANRLFSVEEEDNYQVVLKYIKGDVIDAVVYVNFMDGFAEVE